MRILAAVTVASGLALVGCSSSTPAPRAPTANTPVAVAASSPSSVPSSQLASPPTASAVISGLSAAGLPVKVSVVYTAATDVNHLLGRPGGYVSKAAFVDSRIMTSDAPDSSRGSEDLGGGVEVFPTSAGATSRGVYLQKVISAVKIFTAEYDYTSGPVLLRVSGVLTPDQAAAYGKALTGITRQPATLVKV